MFQTGVDSLPSDQRPGLIDQDVHLYSLALAMNSCDLCVTPGTRKDPVDLQFFKKIIL